MTTNIDPRGEQLLRALTHSLFVEETRMSLTITPPSSPSLRAAHNPSLRAARGGVGVIADGGVMSNATGAHDPSVADYRDTSPRAERVGRGMRAERVGRREESVRSQQHEPLFDLHGFPTAAGRAWLLMQPHPKALEPCKTGDGTRARMAAEIARAVSASGCVTERDLERMGFSRTEIDEHFPAALRQSQAVEMTS